MKAKHIPLAITLLLAAFPAACSHPVVNLNTPQVAENQSRIYTLFVNERLNQHNMIDGTTKAFVVIDGEEHEMQTAPYGDDIYQYDYHMPADRSTAKYFFVIRYDEKFGLQTKHREWKSDQIYTLNVVNRYVLQMEVTRGLVGTVVPVVGRGFLAQDYIVIGGTAAPTKFYSPNSMNFQVPPLPPGDYPVEWHSGSDVFQIGAFHIDMANFKVSPENLEVTSGASTTLTISLDQAAPDGDLPVSVLTDVPASVIMNDVRVPAGQTSVSVKVTGGQMGAGSLRISAPGYNMVTTPVKIDEAIPTSIIPVTPAPESINPVPVPAATPAAPATTDVPATPAPATPVVPEPAPVIRGS